MESSCDVFMAHKQTKELLNEIIIGPMLNLCSGRIKSRIKIPCKMIIILFFV